MDNIILSAALAFFITFFAIPIIIKVATVKKLYDEPDERKVHKMVIPTLGGLGIFAGFIISTLMGSPAGVFAELQYFAAASIVIFFLGIKDDILVLSATKKFIGQLVAGGIVIKFGGVLLNDMHGVLGIHQIPPVASIIFTLFTIIVIINSFNLIDGVDGLAGSLGLLTSITFGTYFLFSGHLGYAVMAFALSGSLIGFLIYNFSPAKIFMGDTGSLLIGLINSILVIKFINIAENPHSLWHFRSAPAIGIAILIVPLFDTLRVFGLRILERRSPFSPDRNHVHHMLLDMGLSHKKVAIYCVLVNIAFIILAYLTRNYGTTIVISLIFALALACITALYFASKPIKRYNKEKESRNSISLKSRNVVAFSSESVETE